MLLTVRDSYGVELLVSNDFEYVYQFCRDYGHKVYVFVNGNATATWESN